MEVLLSTIIFIITLFLYIHITNQYKKSYDMEVYEMDYKNNTELQKICELKQPFVFSLNIEKPINEIINMDYLNFHEKLYVKLKDTKDYEKQSSAENSLICSSYLPFSSVYILMKTDYKGHYFIENNDEFMEESGLNGIIDKSINQYLVPNYSLIVHRKYDVCIGSRNTELPLRYHTYFRRFYIVTHGKVHVKMTHFNNTKYLDPIDDYDIYEHYSPINVWKSNNNSFGEGSAEAKPECYGMQCRNIENVAFLEFDLLEGQVLYVPPYWWYSIKFSNTDDNIICSCTYHSFINMVAHSPELIKYYIHQQNKEKKHLKTMSMGTSLENTDKIHGGDEVSVEVTL